MTSQSTVPSTAYDAVLAVFKRLRGRWFNLLQTSAAAGLGWYLAHDVLHHPQPFFAPISAAVCLSISNVLRAQRAVQMMIGVTIGIGIGLAVHGLMGTGAVPIGVAALISLSIAVALGQGYIGQGMMFANQSVVSSILVLALYRNGLGWDRINDALIGGGLALVFAVLLFPADPLKVLRRARIGVLNVLHTVLSRTAEVAAGRRETGLDWPLPAVDRVHEQVGGLIEARATARQVVRVSPRRWRLRDAVQGADHQAVHVALLAVSVLQLARVCCDRLPAPVHEALVALAAATALADRDPAGASAYTAAARRHASVLQAQARQRADVVIADVVAACVDDVQRVIDLRPQPLKG